MPITELSDEELDVVSGGAASSGSPGGGITTAYFYAGAQPQSYNIIPYVVPSNAAPSQDLASVVAGGRVTATTGNPSQYVGHP